MPGLKYIAINNANGEDTEIVSNDSSAGVADAGKIVALDATGRLSNTMMPVGIVPDVKLLTAGEALNAGDFVELTLTGCRKADATNGRIAGGFVLAAVANAAVATVYKDTVNTSLAGLTQGSKYYLGAAGAVTTVINTTPGQILQFLGVAQSATELDVEISRPTFRA